MIKPDPDKTHLEQDARFPSGPWSGFFLQPSLYDGRVKMALNLTFRDGKVTGCGDDRVGNFSLKGSYDLDSGEVVIVI